MNFTISPKAQKFIRMMMMSEGGAGAGFRLAVSPGGCSGLNAEMAVLSEPMPGDAVVDRDGLRLFLPVESRLLLQDVTIDFTDTPAKTGLVFHDPKATGTCSH
jgi:iron-sulfur cluster assembly accessory protein